MSCWKDEKKKAEWNPGIDSFVMFGFRLHRIQVTEEKTWRFKMGSEVGGREKGMLGEGWSRQRRRKRMTEDEEYKWKRGRLMVSSIKRIVWKDKLPLTGTIIKPQSISFRECRLSVSWEALDSP